MASMRLLVFIVLTSLSGQAPAASIEWYVVTGALNEQGQSLHFGDTQQSVSLMGGWVCIIEEIRSPSLSSRRTRCQSGDRQFEFAVGCGGGGWGDSEHTQIRLKDASGKQIDFIEVGCEVK